MTTYLRGRRGEFIIPITSEIIEKAQQRSSSHCMIADAIKAAYPDLRHVSVDLQTIRFTDPAKGRRYVFLTPPPSQRALINFDQGLPSQPLIVTLRKPSQITKSATRANAPKNADGTPKRYASGRVVAPSRKATVNAQVVKMGGLVPPNAVLSNNRGRVRSFGLSQLSE